MDPITLKTEIVVPYGTVTVRVSKKKTRDYFQGQRILVGAVVVKAYPETLLDDLGLTPEKKPAKETKK